MKPIKYKLKNNIATFIYDKEQLKRFHELGKEFGDVGGILTSIDYNKEFLNYDWYGTIEAPNRFLSKVTVVNNIIYDGKLRTPEEIVNSVKTEENITHNYSFAILNFSEDEK